MKKYIIVIIGALLGVGAQAKPIEKTKAAAIAARYFAKASHKKKELKLVEGNGMRKVKAASDAGAKAFYAFNATDGEGFVIVSGDDELTEIVGYGDKGNIGANGEMSDGLAFFLKCYTKYVDGVRKGRISPHKVAVDDATEIVSPLIKTKWGQTYPFNMYAPENPLREEKYVGRFPIGCVATATAQVINYWQWPAAIDVKGDLLYASHEIYDSERGKLSGAFTDDVLDLTKQTPEPYDWDNMAERVLTYNNAEGVDNYEAKAEAVGKLMRDVAYALNMKWDEWGGGTYSSCGVMVRYFGYSVDVHNIPANSLPNGNHNDEWLNMIKADLLRNQPIIYGGSTKDGDGHCFILDGLKSNDQVSVNWGWGGIDDGWYDITCLNSGIYDDEDDGSWDFSFDSDILHNLHPNFDGAEETVIPLTTDVWCREHFMTENGHVAGPLNTDRLDYFVYDYHDYDLAIIFHTTSCAYGIDFDYAYVLTSQDGKADTLKVENVMKQERTEEDIRNYRYTSYLSLKDIFAMKDGAYDVSLVINVKNDKGLSTGYHALVSATTPPKPYTIYKDGSQCFISDDKQAYNLLFHESGGEGANKYVRNILSLRNLDEMVEGDSTDIVIDIDHLTPTFGILNLDDQSMICTTIITEKATGNEVYRHVRDHTSNRDFVIEHNYIEGFIPYAERITIPRLSAGEYTMSIDYPIFTLSVSRDFTVGIPSPDAIRDIATTPMPHGTKTYNILGQPVSDGYRGIVIRNGRKMMR